MYFARRYPSNDASELLDESDIEREVLALRGERQSIARIAKRLGISRGSADEIIEGRDPLVERLRELGDMLRGASYHPLQWASRYSLPAGVVTEIADYENLRNFFRRGRRVKKPLP